MCRYSVGVMCSVSVTSKHLLLRVLVTWIPDTRSALLVLCNAWYYTYAIVLLVLDGTVLCNCAGCIVDTDSSTSVLTDAYGLFWYIDVYVHIAITLAWHIDCLRDSHSVDLMAG